VGSVCASDHFPFFLELGQLEGKLGSLFKYNLTWASLEEFRVLVWDNWKLSRPNYSSSTSVHFVSNIKRLKGLVSSWVGERQRITGLELLSIEDHLVHRHGSSQLSLGVPKVLEECINLEARGHNLLLDQKQSWYLKSCSLWIEASDENTKFFYKFTNFRKNKIQFGN
jgi:hypothetical protein